MKASTKNFDQYDDYAILTEEGVENGVFFRSPLQKVCFNVHYHDGSLFSAYHYIRAIRNPIRRFFEILIGNGAVVRNAKSWIEDEGAAVFRANILCCPIYFSRKYRKLHAYSSNPNDNIADISSYGYESQFNDCAGGCHIEKTVFTMKDGAKLAVTKETAYHFTYVHVIEGVIRSGEIK